MNRAQVKDGEHTFDTKELSNYDFQHTKEITLVRVHTFKEKFSQVSLTLVFAEKT